MRLRPHSEHQSTGRRLADRSRLLNVRKCRQGQPYRIAVLCVNSRIHKFVHHNAEGYHVKNRRNQYGEHSR